MSKKEQLDQTTTNQFKEGKTDYTETRSLLSSSEPLRLLIGLEDVRNKTDCIEAIYELASVVANNQSDASVIVINELIGVANQKITQHLKILKSDKQKSIDVETQNRNIKKVNNGSEELVQSISRLLTEIEQRSPQLVEENQDKVFNPLVQMFNLVEEKVLPTKDLEQLQQKICDCIISLLPMRSMQVQAMLEEKCIPLFKIDLAKQLVLSYVRTLPTRLHSFFGPVVIDAMTKRIQGSSEDLGEDKQKEIILEIFYEVNFSLPTILNYGHQDRWMKSLLELNSALAADSNWYREEAGLSDEFLSIIDRDAQEKNEVNLSSKSRTDKNTVYELRNVRSNTQTNQNHKDSFLFSAYEALLNRSTTQLTNYETSKLQTLLTELFLNESEPPSHMLAQFKKENFFNKQDVQDFTNLILNKMLANTESYRYQIGALLSIFPFNLLDKENQIKINCSSKDVPLLLRVEYDDRNLCPSAEAKLWSSIAQGAFVVVNEHMVFKLIGKNTAVCAKTFCNSEGYIFFEGVFYSLKKNQDKKKLLSTFISGSNTTDLDATEWIMMRGILPHKRIDGNTQIVEFRKLISETFRSKERSRFRGLELLDFLKTAPEED